MIGKIFGMIGKINHKKEEYFFSGAQCQKNQTQKSLFVAHAYASTRMLMITKTIILFRKNTNQKSLQAQARICCRRMMPKNYFSY
jgi:hypothetical protein